MALNLGDKIKDGFSPRPGCQPELQSLPEQDEEENCPLELPLTCEMVQRVL